MTIVCQGSAEYAFEASIQVPLLQLESQLPEVTVVRSLTALDFKWEPSRPAVQDGDVGTFTVSPTRYVSEYYTKIKIHLYLYQVPFSSTPSQYAIADLGQKTRLYLFSGKIYGKYNYQGAQYSGVAIGNGQGFINDFYGLSIPAQDKTIYPNLNEFNNFLTTPSLPPTDNTPLSRFRDFDGLNRALFFSTISSFYGAQEWQGKQAFVVRPVYYVQLRAWAEPEEHIRLVNKEVAPAEYGWYCQPAPVSILSPFFCNPPGPLNTGYMRFGKIKDARWDVVPENIDIDKTKFSKDLGGYLDGSNRLPIPASGSCFGCVQQITDCLPPDNGPLMTYCPIHVYESQPLLMPPW